MPLSSVNDTSPLADAAPASSTAPDGEPATESPDAGTATKDATDEGEQRWEPDAAQDVADAGLARVSGSFHCVVSNGDGTFTAFFDYTNPNGSVVLIPLGSDNSFDPATFNGRQPTSFLPGHVPDAFSVTAPDGTTLVWQLDRGTSACGSGSTVCRIGYDGG